MSNKSIVIGSGFSGLATATFLAKQGRDVSLFEKNASAGGRARVMYHEGFMFDMGPSWYWMPEVFERYFSLFGKSVEDYYSLKRLDPSYRVFYPEGDIVDIPASIHELYALFEKLEPGSAKKLEKFLEEAEYKYRVGVNKMVFKPGLSVKEYLDPSLIHGVLRLHVFKSFSSYIRKYFKHPYLLQLLEFPVLFLGAMPQETPALYSMMNYADIKLGTWYPMGGMHKIIEGMVSLAKEMGVQLHLDEAVTGFEIHSNKIQGVHTTKGIYQADTIVAGADYHHIEQQILPEKYRKYSASYWDKRVMAPSCLIFYVGVNKRINNLLHHNLFFDRPFEPHAIEIYKNQKWPEDPLFYVSCPSKTDPAAAPEGKENLFILIPIAPGLTDTEEIRQRYFEPIIKRIEKYTGDSILEHIEFQKSYSVSNFVEDYNAFKGNAYGLANTLMQTGVLKPSLNNPHLSNLFYTGQLTVPGPGVPPSLISAEVVSKHIQHVSPV